MRAQTIAVFVTGAILSAGALVMDFAWAQNAPVQPAVQDASIKPIGKVMTATGSVMIEHVTAVVVQAALGNQPGQAKVGDAIYLGDVVSTGADGKVGISFTDGTAFDLSSNARMAMTEFVYDPNSKSNSTFNEPDQRDIHFRCRQDCKKRRHESRHPGRDHGYSRDDTARRNFGRRVGQILYPDRRGQRSGHAKIWWRPDQIRGVASSCHRRALKAQSQHLSGLLTWERAVIGVIDANAANVLEFPSTDRTDSQSFCWQRSSCARVEFGRDGFVGGARSHKISGQIEKY